LRRALRESEWQIAMAHSVGILVFGLLVAVATALPTSNDGALVGQKLVFDTSEKSDDFLEVPGRQSSRLNPTVSLSTSDLERALVNPLASVKFESDPLADAQTAVNGRAQDFENAFKKLGYKQMKPKKIGYVQIEAELAPSSDDLVEEAASVDNHVPSPPITHGLGDDAAATTQDTDSIIAEEANSVSPPGTATAQAVQTGEAETTPSPAPPATQTQHSASVTAAPTAHSSVSAKPAASSNSNSAPAAKPAAKTAAQADNSAAGHNNHMSCVTIAAAVMAVLVVGKF